MVSVHYGGIDEFVREDQNSLRRTKEAEGIFGFDVVQTGRSLAKFQLKPYRTRFTYPLPPSSVESLLNCT